MTAPSRAAKTTGRLKYCILTVCPTVFATAVPTISSATKLNNAAHATATRGRRTWVATTVAIALAESWKPLVKSNNRASAMRPINAAVVVSIRLGYPGLHEATQEDFVRRAGASGVWSARPGKGEALTTPSALIPSHG